MPVNKTLHAAELLVFQLAFLPLGIDARITSAMAKLGSCKNTREPPTFNQKLPKTHLGKCRRNFTYPISNQTMGHTHPPKAEIARQSNIFWQGQPLPVYRGSDTCTVNLPSLVWVIFDQSRRALPLLQLPFVGLVCAHPVVAHVLLSRLVELGQGAHLRSPVRRPILRRWTYAVHYIRLDPVVHLLDPVQQDLRCLPLVGL